VEKVQWPPPGGATAAITGCILLLRPLPMARGMRGACHGSNVHHVDEAGKPRMMKSPLPGTPNVEVVLRHFHRHCYKSSPMWFFAGEGLSP
jgi:hypothetical protein